MKQIVCSNCRMSNSGVDIESGERRCLTCLGTDFEEIELPDSLSCRYCKKEKPTEKLLTEWKKIPFLDMRNGTYYCGCLGWE